MGGARINEESPSIGALTWANLSSYRYEERRKKSPRRAPRPDFLRLNSYQDSHQYSLVRRGEGQTFFVYCVNAYVVYRDPVVRHRSSSSATASIGAPVQCRTVAGR